jgi:hypothetical protein
MNAAAAAARASACIACRAVLPRPELVRLLVVEVEEAAVAGDANVYACKRCLAAWTASRTCPHCGSVGLLYFEPHGGGCVGCESCVADA